MMSIIFLISKCCFHFNVQQRYKSPSLSDEVFGLDETQISSSVLTEGGLGLVNGSVLSTDGLLTEATNGAKCMVAIKVCI